MIGLRLRLLVMVALVASAGIGVVAYQGFQEKARAEAEARHSLLGFAELVAVNHGVLVDQTRTLLGAMAREAVFQGFRDPACDQAAAVVWQRHPHYTGFGVLDANGTVWCLSQPIEGTPDHSSLPHFRRAMATGGFAVGDFAVGSISGKATLGMGMPLRGAAGGIEGVVVAALSSQWANDILAQLSLPPGSAATLVDASGTIVARFPQPQEFVGQPSPVAADIRAAMARGESVITSEGVDGVRRVYAFAPLFPGSPTPAEFVAVGTPPAAIYGSITQRMWGNLAILAVVSGAAGLGSWLLGARAAARLDRNANDLRKANRELAHFADGLAHDLRGPLGSITILTDKVDEALGAGAPPTARKDLASIRSLAAQALSLMRSVLEYARAGKAQGERTPTDLGALARQAVASLQAAVEEAKAQVHVGDLPVAHVDPDAIRRVLQNLVDNALKYRSEEPPVVRIVALPGPDPVSLAVEDNGVGIPPEKLEHVFEPFNRVRTANSASSYGLGLALCRRIVDSHGGRIWAEPRPGGRGTRFRIVLPAGGDAARGGAAGGRLGA